MSTYNAKKELSQPKWLLVDAKDVVLGRLAARVATILRGKHKVTYTPHVDEGDYVIVINASDIKTTGNKLSQKQYYRHTGYPGGIKSKVLADMLADTPSQVIEKAVKGMMPRSKLGRSMFAKLKVYSGAEHPHTAQNPTTINIME